MEQLFSRSSQRLLYFCFPDKSETIFFMIFSDSPFIVLFHFIASVQGVAIICPFVYCQAPPGGAEAPPAPESEEPKPAANPVSKDPRFMRFFKMLQVVGSAVECFSSPEHKLLFIINLPEHNIFVKTF